MSDFHQRGLISTLHRLNPRSIEDLEEEITPLARTQPVALILPCTLDDLRAPAMAEILAHVRQTAWFTRIIVSVNQAQPADLPEIHRLAGSDPRLHLLWNDNPALTAILPEIGLPVSIGGKGFNLWSALGWLALEGSCRIAITHDTDILRHTRELPALLALPLLQPGLGYELVKGYYPRISGQLFGRVTRLFVGPLLRALVRVGGHHPLLDFLDSFRYPLAGEFGARLDLLEQFPLPSGWDLEIDLLCSAHRTISPETVAQIDLGTNYEHKHQALDPAQPHTGLTHLASEIGASLLRNLGREGVAITPDFLAALRAAYGKTAREMIRRYRDVAQINRLDFHPEAELALIEAFAGVLPTFPTETPPPLLPAWTELRRLHPQWCERFQALLDQKIA